MRIQSLDSCSPIDKERLTQILSRLFLKFSGDILFKIPESLFSLRADSKEKELTWP
jgi:hypothetical protein